MGEGELLYLLYSSYHQHTVCVFVSGALTKGDRRAATGADLTEFNFDTPYGRSALRSMYHCICQVGGALHQGHYPGTTQLTNTDVPPTMMEDRSLTVVETVC